MLLRGAQCADDDDTDDYDDIHDDKHGDDDKYLYLGDKAMKYLTFCNHVN